MVIVVIVLVNQKKTAENTPWQMPFRKPADTFPTEPIDGDELDRIREEEKES